MQITVRPLRAEINFLADGDFFDRMDPYVVVRCGASTARTMTRHSGGRNPTWNETLSVIGSPMDTIVFEIWDKDTFTPDDLVATGMVPVQQAIAQGNCQIMLTKGGMNAGYLSAQVMGGMGMGGMGMGMGGMGMGMGMGGMGMGMGGMGMGMGNMGMGMGMGGMGMGMGGMGMGMGGMDMPVNGMGFRGGFM